MIFIIDLKIGISTGNIRWKVTSMHQTDESFHVGCVANKTKHHHIYIERNKRSFNSQINVFSLVSYIIVEQIQPVRLTC